MKTLFQQKRPEPDPELAALKASLADAQTELMWAYRQFDEAVDPELVEACCYQISAVKARCNYLLRSIKERTLAASAEEEPTWM